MELRDHLKELGEQVEYNKGEMVFRQGEASQYIYLIKQGLLKAYYITAGGKEFVKTFVWENDFIGSLSAYHLPEQGCSYSLVCLEPAILHRLKFLELLDIVKQDPSLSITLINIFLHILAKKERREFEFLCLSAEERYQQIKEKTPELLERATQNDIARYLGITPVALSRIRTRITKQGKS